MDGISINKDVFESESAQDQHKNSHQLHCFAFPENKIWLIRMYFLHVKFPSRAEIDSLEERVGDRLRRCLARGIGAGISAFSRLYQHRTGNNEDQRRFVITICGVRKEPCAFSSSSLPSTVPVKRKRNRVKVKPVNKC